MRSAVALILTGVFLMIGCACDEEIETVEAPPPITGPYLGRQPPGTEPTLFLATVLGERDTAWTPDGSELYYSMWERSHGYLLTRIEGANGWSEPAFASFASPEHPELEPFVTSNGTWIYFISKRPLPDGAEPEKFNLGPAFHYAYLPVDRLPY